MVSPNAAAKPAEDREGFRFRGGINAIDLPATLQARLAAAPRDLLATAGDLARWLVAAGLATALPDATDQDLATARSLREAIYALANDLHGHQTDSAEARETLNRIAADTPAVPLLRADGSIQLKGTTAALLVTLAREAVHMFGGEEAGRIRQCQSPTCTLYFVDTSRKGGRRWCSMSACGNKAKVAAFRRHKRAESAA